VSLPTILTGVGPDAAGEDFTRAPLVWQEARALGYRTALVSAQDWEWLSFRGFFLGADAPDVAKTARELGGARVNDSGVDDATVAAEIARFVDGTPLDRPFFVVAQLNATHRPCWAPDIDRAETDGDRCALAARYVDDVSQRVIDFLRARGRLEDTLVIGTSDHGESFRTDRPGRLESYYEDVTRVPLWMRLPAAYVARHPDAPARLAEATHARVSNLDIFPTLLDVWGRWPLPAGTRPPLAGRSLLRAVDRDRALVVASTGDIHDFRWSNEGFALYHGAWKWLCDERRGCRLYDVERDPGEEHDLRAVAPAAERARFAAEIAAHPNLRRILVEMHERW
jgi:arylsulfatase A-like enzyme